MSELEFKNLPFLVIRYIFHKLFVERSRLFSLFIKRVIFKVKNNIKRLFWAHIRYKRKKFTIIDRFYHNSKQNVNIGKKIWSVNTKYFEYEQSL